jgi:hypothetical protein
VSENENENENERECGPPASHRNGFLSPGNAVPLERDWKSLWQRSVPWQTLCSVDFLYGSTSPCTSNAMTRDLACMACAFNEVVIVTCLSSSAVSILENGLDCFS